MKTLERIESISPMDTYSRLIERSEDTNDGAPRLRQELVDDNIDGHFQGKKQIFIDWCAYPFSH